MKFSGINYESFADGDGVRVSFFVSGCHRHCPGCFNPDAQSFDYGIDFSDAVLEDVVEHLKKPYIAGLTMLGGEPMELENVQGTLALVVAAKGIGKSVWVYSGYTFEELTRRDDHDTNRILLLMDILVDGAYIESQRDISLPFRGSSNQRLVNVQESLKAKKAVFVE